MHSEILTKNQKKLLPLIKCFSNQFGMVGGTAIGLLLGHRRSIDFDLFSQKNFYPGKIQELIREKYPIEKIFVETPHELTILVDGVKMTFYKYVFGVEYSEKFDDIIRIPNLLSLAAMKASALGRRAKWKDYVDLYYIFQKYSLKEISTLARKIFQGEFNEKLFREQLAYFDDIDYSEEVEYMEGFEISDENIKKRLIEISLQQ